MPQIVYFQVNISSSVSVFMNNAILDILIHGFRWTHVGVSLEHISDSAITGSEGIHILSLIT